MQPSQQGNNYPKTAVNQAIISAAVPHQVKVTNIAPTPRATPAVERQYTALLGKAQKIKDILDIEEKLGEVRETIEATESCLKTLNDEVAYATITLTLY